MAPKSTLRRPLLGTGLCGALTTFSTVQIELLHMADQHRYALAAGYLLASVLGGMEFGSSHLGIGIILLGIGGVLVVGFLIGTLHTWLITAVGLPQNPSNELAPLATQVALPQSKGSDDALDPKDRLALQPQQPDRQPQAQVVRVG